jgi:hypothetical protein
VGWPAVNRSWGRKHSTLRVVPDFSVAALVFRHFRVTAPSRGILVIGTCVALQLLAFAPKISGHQEGPSERATTVQLTPAKLRQIVVLSKAWSYHPSDDPDWADPAFDDSAWPLVKPDLEDRDAIPGGWPGIGWFRRRVMLDPAAASTTVGVQTLQAGAFELYVDGELAVTFGTVSPDPETELAVTPQELVPISLRPGETHLLAVRYLCLIRFKGESFEAGRPASPAAIHSVVCTQRRA